VVNEVTGLYASLPGLLCHFHNDVAQSLEHKMMNSTSSNLEFKMQIYMMCVQQHGIKKKIDVLNVIFAPIPCQILWST